MFALAQIRLRHSTNKFLGKVTCSAAELTHPYRYHPDPIRRSTENKDADRAGGLSNQSWGPAWQWQTYFAHLTINLPQLLGINGSFVLRRETPIWLKLAWGDWQGAPEDPVKECGNTNHHKLQEWGDCITSIGVFDR